MSSKSILTILLLTLLLFQGCKLPKYLPTYYEFNKSPYGCYIKAKRHGHLGEITGELLLCDETDIYVLRTDLIGNPVHKFEKSSIKKWKVSFYKSSNIRAKFIPAVSIPTIAHGLIGIGSLPITLIASSIIYNRANFQENSRSMSLDDLRKYTRFPNGTQQDVDIYLVKQ